MENLNKLTKDYITFKVEDKIFKVKKLSMELLEEVKQLIAEKATHSNKRKFEDNLKKINMCKNAGISTDIFMEDLKDAKLEVHSDDINQQTVMNHLQDMTFLLKIIKLMMIEDVELSELMSLFMHNQQIFIDAFLKAYGIDMKQAEKVEKQVQEGEQTEKKQ